MKKLILLTTAVFMITQITFAKSEEVNDAKSFSENRILFLNAANFDFFGKLDVNYVGHVNIFAPDLGKIDKLGVNAGIMKLNYLDGDTFKPSPTREYVKLNPLERTLDSGDKYVRQFNQYVYEISNTTWSLYAQPLIRIGDEPVGGTRGISFFAHLHFELLAQTWNIKTTKNTLLDDTALYNYESIYIKDFSEKEVNKSIARLNGYFGVGVTANIYLFEKGHFFIQPTLGVSNKDNFVGWMKNDIPPSRLVQTNEWVGFYLVRAYFTQYVSDAVTITLGTDIRGYLPTYAPSYATYLGANLNIKKLADLLSN